MEAIGDVGDLDYSDRRERVGRAVKVAQTMAVGASRLVLSAEPIPVLQRQPRRLVSPALCKDWPEDQECHWPPQGCELPVSTFP